MVCIMKLKFCSNTVQIACPMSCFFNSVVLLYLLLLSLCLDWVLNVIHKPPDLPTPPKQTTSNKQPFLFPPFFLFGGRARETPGSRVLRLMGLVVQLRLISGPGLSESCGQVVFQSQRGVLIRIYRASSRCRTIIRAWVFKALIEGGRRLQCGPVRIV